MQLETLKSEIIDILSNPYQDYETDKNRRQLSYPPRISDKLSRLFDSVLNLPASPSRSKVFKEFVEGDMNFGPFDLPPEFKIDEPKHTYEIFSQCLSYYLSRMLVDQYEQQQLTYDMFQQCVTLVPSILWNLGSLRTSAGFEVAFHKQLSPECSRFFLELTDRLARQTAQDLSERNCEILLKIWQLEGEHHLIEAARQHQRHHLGVISSFRFPTAYTVPNAISHLANTRVNVHSLAVSERQMLVSELKATGSNTLKALLPVAKYGWELIAEALEWQQAKVLVSELMHHSAESSPGVIEVEATKRLLSQVAEDLAREVLEIFEKANSAFEIAYLYEALMGWNRAIVERKILAHNQLSLKAYALLPIERGTTEIRERYAFIQSYTQDENTRNLAISVGKMRRQPRRLL